LPEYNVEPGLLDTYHAENKRHVSRHKPRHSEDREDGLASIRVEDGFAYFIGIPDFVGF